MTRRATRRAERAASLRRRILAGATSVVMGLGLAVGGLTPAVANPNKTPPTPESGTPTGQVTYDQGGLVCDSDFVGFTKPTALDSPNLDRSGTYEAEWGTLTWNTGSRTVSWQIDEGWDVDVCVKGGTVLSTIDTSAFDGTSYEHTYAGLSHAGFRATPATDEPEMIVDCVQISYETGRPLNEADHINGDVVYNGVRGQINLEINENQLANGHPGSTSGFHAYLKFDSRFGIDDVRIGISQEDLDSGLLIFEYGEYFTGTWTIEWVQFNSTYFNQDRNSVTFVTCTDLPTEELLEPEASMAQLTCDTDGSYTLEPLEGLVWMVSINGAEFVETDAGNYPVTEAQTVDVRAEPANSDYGFAPETDTTWTFGFLEPVDCPTTPLEPTVSVIAECGTYGSITLPDDNPYVTYTVRDADGEIVAVEDAREGEFTVTANAVFPYVLNNYPAGGWTYDLGEHYDCPVDADLRLTYMEECAPDPTYTFRVRNNESFAVPFTLVVVGNPSLNDSGIAEPGDTFIDLDVERTNPAQSYTATLQWGNGSTIIDDQTTKSSGRDRVCSISVAPVVDIDCVTDGTYTLPDVLGITWSIGGEVVDPGTYDVEEAGTITARATAQSGHVIYVDGTLRSTLDFPLVFTEPAGCQPPSFTFASVVEGCERDTPWINYAVQVTDPDGQLSGSNARLIFVDPNGVEPDHVVELGAITVDELLEGRVPWPGASVDGDGNPTGWPGWELNGANEWVETDGNFRWTRDLTEVTLEVNPSMQIALSYPAPTASCASDPTELEPEPVITLGNCFAPDNSCGLADIGGVQWFVDGVPVEPGTYVLGADDYDAEGNRTVVITAQIDEGADGGPYGFADGATTTWTQEFSEVTDEDCVLPLTNAFIAFTDPTCLEPQTLDIDSFLFDADLAELDGPPVVEEDGSYTVVFTAIGTNTVFDRSPDADREGRTVSEDGKTLTFIGTLEGPNAALCEEVAVLDPVEYADTCWEASYTLNMVRGIRYEVVLNGGDPITVTFDESEPNQTFSVNPGDHVLATPVAEPGYVLHSDQPGPLDHTFRTYPDGCQLPEFPNWPASVTATHEACTPFGMTSGSINVELSTGPDDNPTPVHYYLAHGTDDQQQLTSPTTTVPAGDHVVTAVLNNPADSINHSGNEPVEFPVTVAAADESDCDLPTLAITGVNNAVTGVGIGAVIIILAGLGFVLRRQLTA